MRTPLILLMASLSASAYAGLNQKRVLTGKIWSMSEKTVILCERPKKCWEFARSHVDPRIDLRSGSTLTLQLNVRHLRKKMVRD